jgi:hypothetical protein
VRDRRVREEERFVLIDRAGEVVLTEVVVPEETHRLDSVVTVRAEQSRLGEREPSETPSIRTKSMSSDEWPYSPHVRTETELSPPGIDAGNELNVKSIATPLVQHDWRRSYEGAVYTDLVEIIRSPALERPASLAFVSN